MPIHRKTQPRLLNSALKAMDSSFMLEYSGGCINGVLFATYKTTVNVLNDDVVALGVAADAAARRQERKGNETGTYWALKAAQIGVATWAASTTAADLRSWTALPKNVKVARVDRPPDGRLEVVADNQRIQLTLPVGNVMVFIRKPGPSAMPVVKIASF